MKVKFGAIVVDGRGKVGGHVLSKNRGGAYMRTKVTPVNPQTVAQSTARGYLTSLSQGWRELTENQRTAWNAAVSNFQKTDIFGDIKKPSGINLYVKLNTNLLNVSASILTDPPALASSPAFVVFTPTVDSSPQTLSLALAVSPVPANTSYIVEATAPQSPGKDFVKNQFRIVAVIPAAATTPQALITAYTTKFGAVIAGQKVGVRVRAIDELTGVAGPQNTSLTIAS